MITDLRLGTRASELARTQSESVAERLRVAFGRDVRLVDVVSQGDRSDAPLREIGGQGVFVGALREALLRGEVDLVVHSLKDLPTEPHPDLVVAAIPPREDPRDALVSRDGLRLDALPNGARVGTGSPRRAAQLRALGLGFDVVDIRGNVGTRLARVAPGDLDAVVLAHAGLARLDRSDVITESLDPMQMLPAPGQGALAVEVRADDPELAGAITRALDDPDTRAAVTAERAVLRALEAGCSAPVGALADLAEGDDGPELWLRAIVVSPDGSTSVRLSAAGDPADAEGVGQRLATEMLAEGAGDLMKESA